jgi:DNA-binding SARP family transcriptional activator/tetratricopeptide (TPR) repeat protein
MATPASSGHRSGQPAAVRLLVLGAFAAEVGGEPVTPPPAVNRKARTLLKLLAVERGAMVPTETAVEVLWPAGAPARPAENVAPLVSRLRSWLGPSAVIGSRHGYRLGDEVEVDVAEASSLIARAEQAYADGRAGAALVASEQAGRLLARGPVLEDEPAAAWAEPARRDRVLLQRRARLVHAAASIAAGEPRLAAATAEAGVADDPLDEEMTRLLMTALVGAGQPARALEAYARLRDVLADDLGTGPSTETEAVHLALLREEPVPHVDVGPAPVPAVATDGVLVERDDELARLRSAWADAATGHPSVLLVVGEAGIGKTSLAEAFAAEVGAAGGRVLRARCYEAERSLFLQPLVDAVTPVLAAMPPHRLRDLVGDHVDALTGLVPVAAAALGPPSSSGHRPEEARRRSFEAVLHLLRSLGAASPVLLLLDDLHNAGATTVEAVRYLGRHSGGARLLVVATVRSEEGKPVLTALGDVGTVVEPAALSARAVERLAAAAGLGDRAAAIARRTGGHPFFVAEVLRSLAAGQESVPDSLQSAVLGRVERAGPGVDRLLRAAAVLSAEVDPSVVAALIGIAEDEAAARCEDALAARLITVSGRAYEFVNDLVREVLYSSTPAPTRVAWHRRAADLAGQNYEAMARHADAAGETARAARAWLLAAEAAFARFAASDAEAFAARATASAEGAGDVEVLGRARLVRGRALEVREAYADALVDLEGAAGLARDAGDQRLEMMALRELAGDVTVALGLGASSCLPHLDRGLLLARALGDRRTEASLLARRAVVMSNSLQLDQAVAAGTDAVAAGRSSGDPIALVAALDGLKTALSFVGEVAASRVVIDELEPQLRRQGDLFRLQWCVFESAFTHVADADWPRAEERIQAALEVNRRSGYLAYGTWFEAHVGWLLRLQGHHDAAVAAGRRALAAPVGTGHPWWRSTACLLLAGSLAEVGAQDEAADLLAEGLAAAQQDGSPAYVLGCQALLADVTGDAEVLAAADSMLRAVRAPAGRVWMLGAESYLAVARAWLAAGDPGRSTEVLAPVLAAARSLGWRPVLAQALMESAVVAHSVGDPAARQLAAEARALAHGAGMPRVAARAAELAGA